MNDSPRWLGPAGKGLFAAVSTYLAMAGMFASQGLATEATRVSASDPGRTGQLLANARLTGRLTGWQQLTRTADVSMTVPLARYEHRDVDLQRTKPAEKP